MRVVTFLETKDRPSTASNSIVGCTYWLNHDDSVWFSYMWKDNQGLWIINVDNMKLKCVSERLVDRGLNTIHEEIPFGSSKGCRHAQGRIFLADAWLVVEQKIEKAKQYVIDNNLFANNDVFFKAKQVGNKTVKAVVSGNFRNIPVTPEEAEFVVDINLEGKELNDEISRQALVQLTLTEVLSVKIKEG